MDAIQNLPDDPAISISGLTKTYKGVKALSSLDLKVPKNSIFGFLGPNGAGKTTTIKLILGLTRLTAGNCTVFGMDVTKSATSVRRRIGYLAQDPRFYEYMTARRTLKFVAKFFYDGPESLIDERVSECLGTVGLEDKADRPVNTFSGGERQRLGLAQAMVNAPDLLILDEPAASLDPMGRHDVLKVMESLRGKTTIFYSTHILDDVQRVSDTVAILNGGRLIAQAPVEKLLRGGDRVVYSIVARGDELALRSILAGCPWVSAVTAINVNGYTRFEVAVNDESAAEERLLGILAGCRGIRVKEFGPWKYDLEEIFINIMETEDHA
ncbi:ABC transporter ATP binding protein [Methanocella paludicola SANAE]|uniref:ABC transporter ATP binding protein n=1 Tax=Methanocella paludicola (strain DSM 17711 / JCM 13418 / NBRC 101707 / SANAE) TaxID=304371 RepID=D1Z091_METPS|nr:ABC transporter ATP-binding protein [Methanocella paludicola]BAI62113.1 ABC transporter ATP binding protein [Methanocella paludicola SANAE]